MDILLPLENDRNGTSGQSFAAGYLLLNHCAEGPQSGAWTGDEEMGGGNSVLQDRAE